MPYRTQAQVPPKKGTTDPACHEKQREHPVVASENHGPMFGFTGQYRDINNYNRSALLYYNDEKNQTRSPKERKL